MVTALLLLVHADLKPIEWFGPATVTFAGPARGNPYDPLGNDMRVKFTGPKEQWRLAYYDAGSWKAMFTTDRPGSYTATLYRNGVPTTLPTQRVNVRRDQKLKDGYLRIHSAKSRFQFDSGKFYFPLGHNLGWQSPNHPSMVEQIAQMGQNGVNWTRIWANHWDGKNPYWPQDDSKLEPGMMWAPAFEKWDSLVQACEKHEVRMQFVLFHHGLFSDRVNPNWPDHPWNAAKGGFLKDPADFFTDTRARNLAKAWLRYAVARWGHSPGIMAWELFNEVEWVKARYDDRWSDIAKWHDEMAAYLRTIDPYGRLVTTSSHMEPIDYYRSMDYYQPHTYPPSVWGAILGQKLPGDKPLFFGEYGPGTYIPELERTVIRDGIWAGVFSGQAGAGQYWYWDRVIPFYAEYKRASGILQSAGLAEMVDAKPIALKVDVPVGGALTFAPGTGWAETTKFNYDLPSEATPSELAKLAGYFQSSTSGNKGLRKEPVRFRFRATAPGSFSVHVGQIAKGGAALKIFVNDKQTADKVWPAAGEDRNLTDTISADFPAGDVEIRLENDGGDWFVIRGFTVSGIAPAIRVAAIGDAKHVLLRVQAAEGASLPVTAGISGLPLSDGRFTLRETDLDTGAETKRDVQVKSGAIESGLRATARDVVVILGR